MYSIVFNGMVGIMGDNIGMMGDIIGMMGDNIMYDGRYYWHAGQ